MKILFTVAFWSLVLPCMAQEGGTITRAAFEQVLADVYKTYKAENYQVAFDNSVFLNPSDAQPYHTVKGKYIRGKGKQYRTESAGQLTLQTDAVKMVIDSTRKLVLLFKPDTLYNPISYSHEQQDFLWGKATFRLVKAGTVHKYTVVFNQETYEYKSAEYWIDPKTNRVQRMVMYMNPGNYYSDAMEDESLEAPMVVASYSPLPGKLTGKEFLIGSFLKEENGVYSLLPGLDGFELDDLRGGN